MRLGGNRAAKRGLGPGKTELRLSAGSAKEHATTHATPEHD